MNHHVIKGAEWILAPETSEGAPEAIYGAECLTCPEECWMDDDPRPVGAWAIGHTRADATHRQFLMTTQRHWRVDPRPGEPVAGPPRAPVGDERPPARPAVNGLVRRGAAMVGRIAGLVFIVVMSAACGFVAGVLLVGG